MSSDEENNASPESSALTKRMKSGWLVQMPQRSRPEGTPPLQRRPPSPIVIHSSPKPLRCKAKSEEDELAELASAFKRQCQSAPATNVASDVFGSRSEHREDIPRNDEDS
ncbi:uncharacterized protein ARMOST_14692 [Armillaria ostoyae]|uniref:Uncharacterized protein n=1 Tax=Armillaria ostoyae TaxID=47428 RepID=A0A284RR85_ARMOS|nr:uncharacterized protein ARMOST_14692 [Armillaria ostoyae]